MTDRETYDREKLEERHIEKLKAHSREDDIEEICCTCDEDPDTCGNDPGDCQDRADQDDAETRWEGMRDAYD